MSVSENCPKADRCSNVTDCLPTERGIAHVCDHDKDCHKACTAPPKDTGGRTKGKHRRP